MGTELGQFTNKGWKEKEVSFPDDEAAGEINKGIFGLFEATVTNPVNGDKIKGRDIITGDSKLTLWRNGIEATEASGTGYLGYLDMLVANNLIIANDWLARREAQKIP
jgi:hypothetical protein